MPSMESKASSVSDETSDISNQENVSPRAHAPRQVSKSQVRHRASVACASCRERRIRCVVPKGEAECTQCKRTGTDCVIKNDDERRRPISKAYMSSLSGRIALLEGMLKDQGVMPPPAQHPPKTRQEAQQKQEAEDHHESSVGPPSHDFARASDSAAGHHSAEEEVLSPPDSANDDFCMQDVVELQEPPPLPPPLPQQQQQTQTHGQAHVAEEQSPRRSISSLDGRKDDIVQRLLSTQGNLSFDQLSGRFRFFGPTANRWRVYADSADHPDTREPPEQVRRAERIIRSLTAATHDYLMACFWDYYNSVLQVIDRVAFEADRDAQNPKFYSSFLHISILAGGYRFADRGRDDIRKITLGNCESTLHRESKYMLDIELERPGGIPSVQALLILGDLECGVGRDNTGWMYAGMANRLAFDIGLHLDCQGDDVSDTEVQLRHRVMRACVLYDKYWALFLGRPTSIKSQDIGLDLLSRRFSSMLTPPAPCVGPAGDAEVHEQLVELMELAGRIVETRDNNRVHRNGSPPIFPLGSEAEDNAYLHVISIDRQLQNWYRRLPDQLTWKPANIKAAPFSFFLLHQQYHVSMILLHRPWAKYGGGASSDAVGSPASQPSPERSGHHQAAASGHALGLGDPQSLVEDSRTSLSRSICTQQAIRVARIFWQHRQRFDPRKISVTGVQHAGTAAIALIAALAHHSGDADSRTYLGYLEILSAAIDDMSYTYHPAARMNELLRELLVQLRSDVHDSAAVLQHFRPDGALYASVLPLRRENPDAEQLQAFKRRRQAPSRRASEFSRPPPPFFSARGHPTTGPPSAFNVASAAHHHQHQHNQHGGSPHHPHHHLLHQQPTAPPSFFDQSNQFGLDFLNGSAVDFDGADDHSHDDGAAARAAEDYVLVTPSSDGWAHHDMAGDGGGGGGGGGSSGSDRHPEQQHHHVGSFDMPLSDWVSGPTGSAGDGSVHGGSAPSEAGGHAAADGTDPAPALSSSVGSHHHHPALRDGGAGAGAGMEWMGSEGGLSALSPVSLSGLVQSVEKAASGGAEGGPNGGRNHELDFFSF